MQNDAWKIPLKPGQETSEASEGDDAGVHAIEQLIARCLKGDEDAFALIVAQYGDILLRTAYLLVRDEEEAKDIVQDAFFLAWKHLHTLRDATNLRAWLLKIVVNQASSLKRQLMRTSALMLSARDAALHEPEQGAVRIEDRLDLVQVLLRLPMSQRVVVVLFYYQRMTMPEIALLLNVSENTLRKRLQSALEKMRRVLEAEAGSETHATTQIPQSSIGLERGER